MMKPLSFELTTFACALAEQPSTRRASRRIGRTWNSMEPPGRTLRNADDKCRQDPSVPGCIAAKETSSVQAGFSWTGLESVPRWSTSAGITAGRVEWKDD